MQAQYGVNIETGGFVHADVTWQRNIANLKGGLMHVLMHIAVFANVFHVFHFQVEATRGIDMISQCRRPSPAVHFRYFRRCAAAVVRGAHAMLANLQ